MYLKNLTGLKKIKIGHAGTLDPLATGLLIVCTGKKTKSINLHQSETKTYTGTFTLGASTPSYDLETEIDKTYETNHITNDLIIEIARSFIGEINQIMPIYSAIKKLMEKDFMIMLEKANQPKLKLVMFVYQNLT